MSILLTGPPGGGKTTFALQWPGLWVADCDGNLDGPVRWLQKKSLFTPFKFDAIAKNDKGTPLLTNEQWPLLKQRTVLACADDTIQTIFIDSLTHIDRILQDWILVSQKTNDMSFPQWNAFRSELYKYLAAIKSSGKTVIVACHEKIEYGSDFKLEKYVPAVSTNLKDYFGYLFTDVWRCEIRPAGAGSVEAHIRVLPTQYSDLKNSILLVDKQIKATYTDVAKALKDLSK